jgi:hypothetical protein
MAVHLYFFLVANNTMVTSPPNADEQPTCDIGEAQGLDFEVPETPDDGDAEMKESPVEDEAFNGTQASVHSFISLSMPTQLTQPAASIMDNDIDTGLFVFQMSFFLSKSNMHCIESALF